MTAIIASRTLKLGYRDVDIDVLVRIYVPRNDGGAWLCDYEIRWPEGIRKFAAAGADSMQALILALNMIGSEIYTSDYHKSGSLRSSDPWRGYGFPVPKSLRDLLEGDDATYF